MPHLDHTLEGASIVPLENIQTLRTIDATKALLEECLRPSGAVVLHCAQIEEADLSFVQLLLSARKTAERLGATLRLAGVPAALRDVLERCGVADDPFWTGEAP